MNWFATIGIRVERVLSDNGACYRSRYWLHNNQAAGIGVRKTRPYRPQTNGKIERFHRILLNEWAYIQDWTTEQQRHTAYRGFMHFYNHHRSHGALNWHTPAHTLNHLHNQDNAPVMHT